MRPVADAKLLFHRNAQRLQRVHLFHQRRRVYHHAIPDHRRDAGPKNAARNQLQNIFLRANENRVARIVPALVTRHNVETVREKVHHLALSLIAPLCSKNNYVAHAHTSRTLSLGNLICKLKTSNCIAGGMIRSERMQISDIFVTLGEPAFEQILRSVSIGKLKTYQLYERVKLRFHLAKLNGESLRKAAPRLYARIAGGDQEFATDVAQTVLVSHLDMIKAVLDFLEIPHEDGFFAKDLDPAGKLTEGWQARTWEKFRAVFPEAVLLFYINHLDWELTKPDALFQPAELKAS
jgi:hypothetical protein